MTSDAQIGLLLGLVFIFVIAFVINGLPSLRPPLSKVEANTTVLPDENFEGVARKTEAAVTNWTELADQQRTGGDVVRTAVEAPKPVVLESPQAQSQPPLQTLPQTASDPGVRSSYSLTGIEKLIEQLTPTIQKDRVVADIDLAPHGPAAEPPAARERPSVATAPQPPSEPMFEPKPVETLTKVETREVPKPANVANKLASIPSGSVYTVVDGDNLASISKKVYGPEEGNRVVNVQRIYHANEILLKSAHQLSIGQKLIIPPLPKAAAAPAPRMDRPVDVLPKTLFEEPKTLKEMVASLGRPAPAAVPAAVPEGRWYTVQNGDNLWKIAASQLGSGTRCDEIAKLNAEILKSRDSLDVGMKLRLPPK
jgi:nucleoid-associated protein YgaU